MIRARAFAAILLSGVFALGGARLYSAPPEEKVAPFLRAEHPLEGSYLVRLLSVPGSSRQEVATRVAREHGGNLKAVFSVFPGMHLAVPASAIEGLRRNPWVVSVEEDGEVRVAATTQSWSLDRIDQQYLPLNGDYTTCAAGGQGNNVRVYVVDTGILAAHQEFYTTSTNHTSRVSFGWDGYVPNQHIGTATAPCPASWFATGNAGHGTGVASVIGGLNFGVAVRASLVSVRALDCTGRAYLSTVVTALEWIPSDPVWLAQPPASKQPRVVNLSFEYFNGQEPYGNVGVDYFTDWNNPYSENNLAALDLAVSGLLSQGITVAAAAGNHNVDAANSTPARVNGAIAVGATDATDKRWTGTGIGSNTGSVISVCAPGANTLAAFHTGTSAVRPIGESSGTSFSAAIVSGVAARLLELYPLENGGQIKDRIQNESTHEIVSDPGAGSPNRLVYRSVGRCRPI